MREAYYIGWDVGAWNCTSKSKSCDALVVLNDNGIPVGEPYRESLKNIINSAKDVNEFLTQLVALCKLPAYNGEEVCLAIDTPLGYSQAFVNLITSYKSGESIPNEYPLNPYLFRKTEQHIFNEKIVNHYGATVKPLSAVNDMIGSQSTKGIHVISTYAPSVKAVGVWMSDCQKLTIIETYPSVNFEIKIPKTLKEKNQDIQDAFICAHIAYLFNHDKKQLAAPVSTIPEKEGWIWYVKK